MRVFKIFLPFALLSLFSLCPFLPKSPIEDPTATAKVEPLPSTGETNTPTLAVEFPTATWTAVPLSPTPTTPEILPSPTPETVSHVDIQGLQGISAANIQNLSIIAELDVSQDQPNNNIIFLTLSSDGTKFALITENEDADTQALLVWDLITNTEIFTIEGLTTYPNWVAFSPDDQKIWVATIDFIDQYNLQSGLVETAIEFYLTDADMVSPDGRYYLRGAWVFEASTSIIKFYIFGSLEPFYTEEAPYFISSFQFSPDSKMVAGYSWIFGKSLIKIWDVETGNTIMEFNDFNGIPVFSGDASLAALAKNNQFSIFSTDSWDTVKAFQNDNPANTNLPKFFLSGNQVLAVQDTALVTFHDVDTGEALFNLPEEVTIVNYCPIQNFIITSNQGNGIKVWGIHE
jgi:WD40 repeat protein